jgi:integrase/recombinase XerD
MASWTPSVVSPVVGAERVALGHRLVDDYLEVVRARCRRNTVRATAYDLKVFFTEVAKDPVEVTVADVLGFIRSQRGGGGKVVRLADGGSGLALSTVRRRLSTVSGLYSYLVAVGVVDVNPVLRGMAARSSPGRVRRGAPLVRQVRRLPQVLMPDEVNALLGALRRWRDRAMIEAMLLGGLRRSEVLGLRLEDLGSAERRVFVVDGKGGHQRWVPISSRFFASVTEYLHTERPADTATDRVFVVLKGPHRGQPLTAKGLEQIMRDARARAGLSRGTCHELRHTCLTRLREAGMALEAIQAQAGHRSIESTRIYLHLADGWVAAEYRKAAEAIDAQAQAGSRS